MPPSIGIHAIGVQLPARVRHNDWWPDHVVTTWRDKIARRMSSPASEPATEGERRIRDAVRDMADDPFAGALERRVLEDSEKASDLEIAAGARALERAGCRPEEIDLLVVSSIVPDHLLVNAGCAVQHGLELRRSCLVLHIEAGCNSFLHQLAVAEAMIAAGRVRRALLVQSSALSRVLPIEDPHSAWFGDGASAVVVGPVSAGRGLVARTDGSDGSLCAAVVGGVPGGRWFDEGRVVVHNADHAIARTMIKGIADIAKEAIDDCLESAGFNANDVDFFACHQGVSWQRRVTQEYVGMSRAKALDTFSMTGNVSSVNIPLVLSMAENDGLVRDGDLVLAFASGTGLTWSSVLLRWGV